MEDCEWMSKLCGRFFLCDNMKQNKFNIIWLYHTFSLFSGAYLILFTMSTVIATFFAEKLIDGK